MGCLKTFGTIPTSHFPCSLSEQPKYSDLWGAVLEQHLVLYTSILRLTCISDALSQESGRKGIGLQGPVKPSSELSWACDDSESFKAELGCQQRVWGQEWDLQEGMWKSALVSVWGLAPHITEWDAGPLWMSSLRMTHTLLFLLSRLLGNVVSLVQHILQSRGSGPWFSWLPARSHFWAKPSSSPGTECGRHDAHSPLSPAMPLHLNLVQCALVGRGHVPGAVLSTGQDRHWEPSIAGTRKVIHPGHHKRGTWGVF